MAPVAKSPVAADDIVLGYGYHTLASLSSQNLCCDNVVESFSLSMYLCLKRKASIPRHVELWLMAASDSRKVLLKVIVEALYNLPIKCSVELN